MTATPIVEVVPLRQKNDTAEVLLTRREDDDPNWPGMLHTPGTVVRASDAPGSYNDAFRRILDTELKSVELAGEPQFVETILHDGNRGMEDAKIYYVEVVGEPTEGTFYDANNLPSDTVKSQIGFIQSAVSRFLSSRSDTLQ